MKTVITHLVAYVTSMLAHIRDALPAIEEVCLKVRHSLTDEQLQIIKDKIVEVEKTIVDEGSSVLKKAAVHAVVQATVKGISGQASTSIIETLIPIALSAL